MEQNGTLSDLIFVTKNNATSEQNLTILVQGFDVEANSKCHMRSFVVSLRLTIGSMHVPCSCIRIQVANLPMHEER